MARVNEDLWELRTIYRAEHDPDERAVLKREYERALNAALALSGQALGDNTQAYEDAADQLSEAIKALKKAKREAGKTAEAISKIAAAIDLIAGIAANVA